MRAHQLNEGGVVVNTIVVDSLDALPNLVDAELGGAVGDAYDVETGMFTAPSNPSPPVVDLPALRQRLVAAVDELIAGIYQRWTRFETEYTAREAAARAFVAAAYEGDPGVWVSAFATAAGMTNTAAADLIIVQADGLRAALEQLGALRMRKYEIALAVDAVTAQAAHDDITALAATIAAGL